MSRDDGKRVRLSPPPGLLKAIEAFQPKLDRIKAGRVHRDSKKLAAYEALAHMTPREVDPFVDYLPDPFAKVGRPKNKGTEDARLDEMERRIPAEKKTPVAREIVSRGLNLATVKDLKGRTDALVRLFNQRQKLRP